MSSSEALEALERREYERALVLLEGDLAARPGGELHALAGLASFQLERYDAAAQHYAAALQADGERSDWREMLTVAQANATAGVNVHVPELHYFDRDVLLAPPSVRRRAAPAAAALAGAWPLQATVPVLGRVAGSGSDGVNG
jgi:tetratricopeptide (TPR) repeat protein